MRNLLLCLAITTSVVAGLLAIVTPVRADAVITVTTTSDAVASDGLCSLREAIIAANTDSAFSDCPAGSGADTIAVSFAGVGGANAAPGGADFTFATSGLPGSVKSLMSRRDDMSITSEFESLGRNANTLLAESLHLT